MKYYCCEKCGAWWDGPSRCACGRDTDARNRPLNRREQVALAWLADNGIGDDIREAFAFADNFCRIADETEAK